MMVFLGVSCDVFWGFYVMFFGGFMGCFLEVLWDVFWRFFFRVVGFSS